MAIVAVDTNVIVAALASWHANHSAAAAALDRALRSDSLILPSHVLIESYSVLTRMPAPHRLSPRVAYELLSKTFESVRLAPFRPRDLWAFLREVANQEIAGGAVYDAVIAESARAASAETLLTFNLRDFERLDLKSITLVEPE